MKRHIVIIAAALVACSCSKILNNSPKNQISTSSMWTTASMTRAGMDGLMYPFYWHDYSLSTQMRKNGQGGINRLGLEGMGYTSILDGTIPFLKESTKTASGVECYADWVNLYTVIQACNTAIDNMKRDVLGDHVYEQYICEARMIRAYAYSRLNMIYGEVPIYLHEITYQECNKAQNTWDEVWDLVIKECTECIENAEFQDNNFGERFMKPSKGMAYALRGNAYMWLAANKNPQIYEDHPGIADDKIKNYYSLAEKDFDNLRQCGFDLFKGNWEDLFQEANEHSCEMIFPLEFSTVSGHESMWNWIIGPRSNLNSWNRLVPSFEFVEDFEWNDGTKFDWTQVFPDWKNIEEAQREVFFLRDSLNCYADSVAAGSKVEKYIALNDQRTLAISRVGQDVFDKYYLNIGNEARLLTAYENRDPRLGKAVVIPYKPYRMFVDTGLQPRPYVQRWPRFKRQDDVDNSDMWLEFSANMVHQWYKGLVTDGSIIIRFDGIDWPLLRYTQFHLMRAEALVHLNRPGEALGLLNEVRARAGMPDFTSTDPAALLAEIQYDTRIELCTEGKDFFNEIRWDAFRKKKFQGKKFTDPHSCWGAGGWKTGYYYVEGMWPLSAPLDEIVMNSNLRKRPFCWTY